VSAAARGAVHLLGIGGVGMSGIARVLAASGAPVSGCDRAESAALERLRAEGIACAAPHDPAHLQGVERLIVSGAIADDEPELAAARTRGLPVEHRADALASILAAHERRVVVTGAHGKTTTTAMLAAALHELGRAATFLVGGEVSQLGTNAAYGDGGLCVAEGDESDRSVARLPADVAVVLNVDLDHLDHYASVDDVRELLAGWVARLPAGGLLVAGDGVGLDAPCPVARFGIGPGEGLRVLEAAATARGVAFRPSRGPSGVELAVPGEHNALNACAAALVLEHLGVPLDEAFTALAGFRGAGRRFELVGERDGIRVVDDYAHHPAELAATLAAARAQAPARLVVCFQPHMPWRTRRFAREFADVLAGADVAVVCETYVARGRPDPEGSARRILEALCARRPGARVAWAPDLDAAATLVRALARPGDLVLCCGAGPVDRVARAVAA
jgi:UDP-N-acetylmuramate--alanine ligase